MFDIVVRLIRAVAPSFLSDLKSALVDSQRLLRKSKFWNWTTVEIAPEDAAYVIHYFGTEQRKEAALTTLQRRAVGPPFQTPVSKVTISEFPISRSLRVPQYVDMDVPVDAPMDDVLGKYPDRLRRVVLQQLPHAELVEATALEDFAFADEQMLRPYAIDRHGSTAAQIPLEQIVRLSQPPYGRLHILRMDGEPVACHLGVHEVRAGRRYWTGVRVGYVQSVFTDPKRLNEVNSTNVFLATKCAKDLGADFYSLGMSRARPDEGSLHWKRRRGGVLNARTCHEWFYVRAPDNQAPAFFWDDPLFAIQGRKKRLSLHVGLPTGAEETSVVARYREIHFLGIHEVIIHAARTVPLNLVDKTAALLAGGADISVTHRVHNDDVRMTSLSGPGK